MLSSNQIHLSKMHKWSQAQVEMFVCSVMVLHNFDTKFDSLPVTNLRKSTD